MPAPETIAGKCAGHDGASVFWMQYGVLTGRGADSRRRMHGVVYSCRPGRRSPGGWVRLAMERDSSLSDFVNTRLGADGVFCADGAVMEVISRIATKTAAGLLFHEFGRIVPLAHISLVAVEHSKNFHPAALAEINRRDGALWAEVTPSGRELERQVLAWYGREPPHMPKWRNYVPGFFEYMFLRRSNNMLLTAMKLHDALTVLFECPWPSRAGPRRKGRPPRGSQVGRESGGAVESRSGT